MNQHNQKNTSLREKLDQKIDHRITDEGWSRKVVDEILQRESHRKLQARRRFYAMGVFGMFLVTALAPFYSTAMDHHGEHESHYNTQSRIVNKSEKGNRYTLKTRNTAKSIQTEEVSLADLNQYPQKAFLPVNTGAPSTVKLPHLVRVAFTPNP